jgi:hypothetical protein
MLRVVSVCAVVLIALTASALVRPRSAATPVGTFSGCPRDTRPLPERVATFARALRVAVRQFLRTQFPHIATVRQSS